MVQGLKCRSMKCLKSPFHSSWTTHMFKLDTCLVLYWAEIPNLVLTTENEECIRLSCREAIPRTKVLDCRKFLLSWVKTNLQNLSLKFSKWLMFSQQMLWAWVYCLFIKPGKRRIMPFYMPDPTEFHTSTGRPWISLLNIPCFPQHPLLLSGGFLSPENIGREIFLESHFWSCLHVIYTPHIINQSSYLVLAYLPSSCYWN